MYARKLCLANLKFKFKKNFKFKFKLTLTLSLPQVIIQNFSLQYQYNIKQVNDENREYQLWD